MTRPEIYKLAHHRTPAVLAGMLTLLVLAVPTWFAFRAPTSVDLYFEAMTGVFGIGAALLGAVFGAWLLGHEFRQGTLRRVAAVDARRGRLLTTKAMVGLVAFMTALIAIAGLAVGASLIAAAINGHTLLFAGVVTGFLGVGLTAVVTATIAYLLSIVLRSDTYAMLGALAVMVVFGPLLSLIPTIGRYMPSALSEVIANQITNTPVPGGLAIGTAVAVLGAMLAAVAATATALFARSDI